MQQQLNESQRQIVRNLGEKYGVVAQQVKWMENGEPWLPSEVLIRIARETPSFRSIEEGFDRYIEQLAQVVHRAQYEDRDGNKYAFCGVATLGERLPTGEEVDPHDLAASRALVKTLNAAGINPLKQSQARIKMVDDGENEDTQSRLNDYKRIHILARDAGLIREEGDRRYREWLMERYGVNTSTLLDAAGRASVINALKQLCVEKV